MKKINFILAILSLTVGAVYAHVDHKMSNDQSMEQSSLMLVNFSIDNTVEHK